MAKYSAGAGKKVEKVMDEMKEGKLKSGRSNRKVTSRQQAIAIGLSEARKKGAKVPPNPNEKKKAAAKKKAAPKKKTPAKKAAPKKKVARKAAPAKKAAKKKAAPAKKSATKRARAK